MTVSIQVRMVEHTTQNAGTTPCLEVCEWLTYYTYSPFILLYNPVIITNYERKVRHGCEETWVRRGCTWHWGVCT